MNISSVIVVVLMTVSCSASNVNRSQPVLQVTIEELFADRSQEAHQGACKLHKSSKRQMKLCRRDGGLPTVLAVAKEQAITACEEAFHYDRWNCSLTFNHRANRTIFHRIYRETAFIHALMSASITHAVAKGCATGDMTSCSCTGTLGNHSTWKGSGCGDDFKYGKRVAKNFLDFKHGGNDRIGETLKQDVMVGINSIGEQLREVCKCHGFSGSCTTKTCWKRLGPFNSAMGLLKKHYHHAVKRKYVNLPTKRAITPKVKKKLNDEWNGLVYLYKSPNLCSKTKGRICRDRHNCATLCCTRGFVTSVKNVTSRCRCRMVNCCFVECDRVNLPNSYPLTRTSKILEISNDTQLFILSNYKFTIVLLIFQQKIT